MGMTPTESSEGRVSDAEVSKSPRGISPVRAGWASRTSVRVRALLSLGVVLGLGSVSTMAYWTDTATMSTGSFTSGSLDLRLQGNLAGQGGDWTNADLAMSKMIPGESVAVTVPVQRAGGSIGFRYGLSATATGALAPYLRWDVAAGTAGAAGTSGSGLRTQHCSGAALSTANTLSGDAVELVRDRALTGSAMSETLCLRVELPASAGNAAQAKSATASFVFDATQIG